MEPDKMSFHLSSLRAHDCVKTIPSHTKAATGGHRVDLCHTHTLQYRTRRDPALHGKNGAADIER
jgi:hypothetical protein